MGALAERPVWEADLYRIQHTDPILGGEDGVVNIQPGQLARRTAFLRAALALEHDPATGLHRVTGAMLTPDAALAEARLALDRGTAGLAALLAANLDKLNLLRSDLTALIGPDGTLAGGLGRVLRQVWEHGGFDFELFSGRLTMRDLSDLPVAGAVAGDDSVDCADTSGLLPGMRLLIRREDRAEEIEVREVLTRHRFRTVADLSADYAGGLLGRTTWTVREGGATAAPGAAYLSRPSHALRLASAGWLAIRRDRGPGELRVEARDPAREPDWRELVPADANVAGGRVELFFPLPPRDWTQIRVTGVTAPVDVDHLVLFGVEARTVWPVRTPRLWFPRPALVDRDLFYLDSSLFRCAYGDGLDRAEFELSPSRFFDTEASHFRSAPGDRHVRVPLESAPAPGNYLARCRHVSDMGDASRWSPAVACTVREAESFFGFAGAPCATGFREGRFNTLSREPRRFGFAGTPGAGGFDEAPFRFGTPE